MTKERMVQLGMSEENAAAQVDYEQRAGQAIAMVGVILALLVAANANSGGGGGHPPPPP